MFRHFDCPFDESLIRHKYELSKSCLKTKLSDYRELVIQGNINEIAVVYNQLMECQKQYESLYQLMCAIEMIKRGYLISTALHFK